MCNSKYNLKLCTCNDFDKAESSWSLRRFKGSDWMDIEGGRCFVPKYTSANIWLGEKILKELNSNNCFDYDFNPEDGDTLDMILYISNEEIPYEFLYVTDRWIMEGSISSHLNKKNIIQTGGIK